MRPTVLFLGKTLLDTEQLILPNLPPHLHERVWVFTLKQEKRPSHSFVDGHEGGDRVLPGKGEGGALHPGGAEPVELGDEAEHHFYELFLIDHLTFCNNAQYLPILQSWNKKI